MKAIAYRMKGGVEVLTDIDLPDPVPGARDLLVSVRAISVNPVDVKRRHRDEPSDGTYRVLGYDAAGIVKAVGSDVTRFKPGDAVYYAGARDRPGTNAELHLVDERIVGCKPKSISFAEAAALPLTSITAWEILFDRMKLPYGRRGPAGTLLVLNGAGGVGSMVIQLARRLTGLTVVASASRAESAAWVRSLGAHHVVNHNRPIDEEIRAIGLTGVDYVAALTTTAGCGPGLARAINPQGHITLVDDFNESIAPFKQKSVTISWEMMFTRSMFETSDMAAQHELLNEISALVDAGVLRTTLAQTLGPINAESLRKAHDIVGSGRTMGKIVLEGFQGS